MAAFTFGCALLKTDNHDPAFSFVLGIDGSLLGYLSTEIAIHNAQGQVDSAGLSSGRGRGDLFVLNDRTPV